jgi:hypothetical protein
MTMQPLFPVEKAQESLTWADVLDDAGTPQDVLKIAKDFLATWDPYELAALPADCKPPAYFVEPEDIVNYAFTLVQSHCGPAHGDPGVYRMVKFFSHAARRVAILMSAVPPALATNEPRV